MYLDRERRYDLLNDNSSTPGTHPGLLTYDRVTSRAHRLHRSPPRRRRRHEHRATRPRDHDIRHHDEHKRRHIKKRLQWQRSCDVLSDSGASVASSSGTSSRVLLLDRKSHKSARAHYRNDPHSASGENTNETKEYVYIPTDDVVPAPGVLSQPAKHRSKNERRGATVRSSAVHTDEEETLPKRRIDIDDVPHEPHGGVDAGGSGTHAYSNATFSTSGEPSTKRSSPK